MQVLQFTIQSIIKRLRQYNSVSAFFSFISHFVEGRNPYPLDIWPHENKAYVALYNENLIAVVNLDKLVVDTYIHGFRGPDGFSYTSE